MSIGAAVITARQLPSPSGLVGLLLWWYVVLAVPMLVLAATEWLARRLSPLAVLLKMTMVFPDRAPKRLALARKAGNTRDLARRVDDARRHGIHDEPTRAAEEI
ncbi:MAG: hypothetical protein JO368_01800, partial [Acidimicrobiales bacterium]|nr:hypothetical protein [Acidimicrobiales bacterium]